MFVASNNLVKMNLCEICLVSPEFKVNIFGVYLDKYNLKDIIYELAQVEVGSCLLS